MALTLKRYCSVLVPLAGVLAFLPKYWSPSQPDAQSSAPQAGIEPVASQETCSAPIPWDATYIQYGSTPTTGSNLHHSPQYITVKGTLTVTETSVQHATTFTVHETATVTKEQPTTTTIAAPTVTSTVTTFLIKEARPVQSKERVIFLVCTIVISVIYGLAFAIWLSLWLPSQLLGAGQIDETAEEPAATANERAGATVDADDFWTEKRAYVAKRAEHPDNSTAILDCLQSVFDGAAEPLSYIGLAKELAKYIRSRAVENNDRAIALTCPSEDHTRAFETAKRVARSHIARYPEASIPHITNLLLRELVPFVDNLVLRNWLKDLKDNTDLIDELASHKYANCPADVRQLTAGAQRYPRSPSRPVREASSDSAERGRKRLPKPTVSSRASSPARESIRSPTTSPRPSKPSVEITSRRELLKQVILQLKHDGVDEDWLQKNLAAVHTALQEQMDAVLTVQRISKLYRERPVESRSIPKMENLEPPRPSFGQPLEPEPSLKSASDQMSSPAALNGATGTLEPSLHVPHIEVSDYGNQAIEHKKPVPEAESSSATNKQLSPQVLHPQPALDFEQSPPDLNELFSPEYLESKGREQDRDAESSSSEDNEPTSPSPAPRPGWVKSVQSRKTSSKDTLSRYGSYAEMPPSRGESRVEVLEDEANVLEPAQQVADIAVNSGLHIEEASVTEHHIDASIQGYETMADTQLPVDADSLHTKPSLQHEKPEAPFTIDPDIIDQLIINEIENAPIPGFQIPQSVGTELFNSTTPSISNTSIRGPHFPQQQHALHKPIPPPAAPLTNTREPVYQQSRRSTSLLRQFIGQDEGDSSSDSESEYTPKYPASTRSATFKARADPTGRKVIKKPVSRIAKLQQRGINNEHVSGTTSAPGQISIEPIGSNRVSKVDQSMVTTFTARAASETRGNGAIPVSPDKEEEGANDANPAPNKLDDHAIAEDEAAPALQAGQQAQPQSLAPNQLQRSSRPPSQPTAGSKHSNDSSDKRADRGSNSDKAGRVEKPRPREGTAVNGRVPAAPSMARVFEAQRRMTRRRLEMERGAESVKGSKFQATVEDEEDEGED